MGIRNDWTYECGCVDGTISSITDWRLETKAPKWRGRIWDPNIFGDLGDVCCSVAYDKAAGSPHRLTNIPHRAVTCLDVLDGSGSCEKGKSGNVL